MNFIYCLFFFMQGKLKPAIKHSRGFYLNSANPLAHIKHFVTSHTRTNVKTVGKSQSLTDEQIVQEINKDHRRPCSLSVDLPSALTTVPAPDEDTVPDNGHTMGQSHCFVALPHHSANDVDSLAEEPHESDSLHCAEATGARRLRHNSEGSSPIEPRPVLKKTSVGRINPGSKFKKKQVTIEERATVLFLPSNANPDSKADDTCSDINANEPITISQVSGINVKHSSEDESKGAVKSAIDLDEKKNEDKDTVDVTHNILEKEKSSQRNILSDTVKDKNVKNDKKSPERSDSSSEGTISYLIKENNY